MYLYRSFLLLVGCLFCFATHALAAPSLDISSLEASRHQDHAVAGEGQLNARSEPYNSTYDDGNTSIARNRRRGGKHELECNKLSTRYYTFREYLHARVSQFCKHLPTSGTEKKNSDHITETFNQNTKEQFILTIDIHGDYKPHRDACEEGFLSVTDDCNLPDDGNPHNVKAGGTLRTDHFTYRIKPEVKREPAIHALGSGCRCDLYFHKDAIACKLWGHGWATEQNGLNLKEKLMSHSNCIKPDTFRFKHKMPKEGIEWEAYFDATKGDKACVVKSMAEAGATAGSHLCGGSGY